MEHGGLKRPRNKVPYKYQWINVALQNDHHWNTVRSRHCHVSRRGHCKVPKRYIIDPPFWKRWHRMRYYQLLRSPIWF